MAKYIANVTGQLTEVSGQVTGGTAGQAGLIVQLDAGGRLDATVMPVGVGADTATIVASEALVAGNIVNIYDNAGAFNCRKADAATNKPAHGFVLAAVAISGNATVYFEGSITGLAGLTPGVRYVGAAGATSATAATVAGSIVQRVGLAVSATVMNFEQQTPILLA